MTVCIRPRTERRNGAKEGRAVVQNPGLDLMSYGGKVKTMPKVSVARKEECRARLLELLTPGDTVYTTLKHVSRSGMMRVIDLHIIKDNEPLWIGRTVADLLEDSYDDKKNGIRVGGCGMDMGFAVVYELSHKLFPDGFDCIGDDMRCPSSDHNNGDRNYSPDHVHKDGGYALRHRWL